MSSSPLLIEIGVEELPAIPFLKELPHIAKKWQKVLKAFYFEVQADSTFYYTPRRLVLYHGAFPIKQANREQALYGAPLEIAFKEGKPTPAALSFAQKCGVDVKELSRATKNGKEVLYYKQTIIGEEIGACIGDMVSQFLQSLDFGKGMRWGSDGSEVSFIRPIRWILCKMGKQSLPFSTYGVEANSFTYPHRQNGHDKIIITDANSYLEVMRDNGVIVDQQQRRAMVEQGFDNIAHHYGVTIRDDKELLDEVIAITEHPKALLGEFDKRFLRLPKEVIIHSMREHQRYFSLFQQGELAPYFLVVADTVGTDTSLIIKGNSKVLVARLEDALFFYDNDLNNGLDNRGLKHISFMDKMGSLWDKMEREQKIALYLSDLYGLDKALIEHTIELCSADLLSEMVYEFTDLQGIMGYYYAKAMGERDEVAIAIKEQYLPTGENSPLPSSLFGAVVALSHKLDLLFSLFSLDQIPTGSKDPYALRRAVIGIIKIVLHYQIPFDIKAVAQALMQSYNTFSVDTLCTFYYERFYQYFSVNNALISAVISSNEYDIVRFSDKLKALEQLTNKPSFREDFSTFKRIANILDKYDDRAVVLDSNLLQLEAEKALYKGFVAVDSQSYTRYEDKLFALFDLSHLLTDFFAQVMVNDDDRSIRANRHALLSLIYDSFKAIGDIKQITL